MEEDEPGRNLIILATTLILLAGSLRLYIDNREQDVVAFVSAVEAVAYCDANSINLVGIRFGCQTPDVVLDTRVPEASDGVSRLGAAKFIAIDN